MNNPVILSVAEKPSVAKELAKIISGGEQNFTRRPGHSPFNHIFEIGDCKFKGQPAKMKITSVSGHMMQSEFEGNYSSWNSCAPIDLFEAPIEKKVADESNLKIERTLVDEAKHCSILLLWLDCDLEGENICFEVLKVCKLSNPRIDVFRARFSALIPRDIFRTLQFPERPNENYSNAVEARQEIDLRLGAAFTRFQSLRIQRKFSNFNKTISYGPCQFPTLGFVVERYQLIQEFRPERYWSISCCYDRPDTTEKAGKINCDFAWTRGHIYDRFSCMVLYESCLDGRNGGLATVIKCDQRPTTRSRPVPLNTVELQKRASRLLGMSSDKTMAVAEELYHRGILSYPRTETDFFKEGFELTPLIEEQRSHSQWGEYAAALLDNNKFLWPGNGGHDDQAHPPIHPLKKVEPNEFKDDKEKQLYDFVTRHFLACASLDATGSQTNVTIAIPQGGTETFSTTGLMIIERNWLDVYGKYDQWYAKKLPLFAVGDSFRPLSLLMTTGETTAPLPLNESELITDMDRNKIGTDATIASHIATIQTREYAVKDNDNRFVPTKLGLALIEAYNSMGYQLNKPAMRAQMEADCQRIAKGELKREDVVRKCLATMKECFITCNREADKLDAAMSKHFRNLGETDDINQYRLQQRNFSSCGKCRGMMDLREELLIAGDAGDAAGEADAGRRKTLRRYLYCARCREGHVLPGKHTLSAHHVQCAICRFQVLSVLNEDTQKSHTVCPFCFKHPPGVPYSDEFVNEFRCFSCKHPSCALASANVVIAPCAAVGCVGMMQLRKFNKSGTNNNNNNGNNIAVTFMCACSKAGCTQKWYLPRYVKSCAAGAEKCAACFTRSGGAATVMPLQLQLDLSSAPPGVPPELTLCPCCDRQWSRDLHCDPLPLSLPQSLAGQGHGHGHGQEARSIAGAGGRVAKPFVTPLPASHTSTSHRSSAGVGGSSTSHQVSNQSTSLHQQARQHQQSSDYDHGHDNDQYSAAISMSSSSYSSRGDSDRDRDKGGGGAGEVTCKCDGAPPAPLLTVNKEGANKGRTFYSCSKRQCGFFQWSDEMDSLGQSGGVNSSSSKKFPMTPKTPKIVYNNTNSTSRQMTNNSSNSSQVCSHCHQSGHFARSCPNKSSGGY